MEHYSSSVQETEALGRALAQHLTPGTVVAFTGDLGAGKTAFVRGMAQGLGIAQRVTSKVQPGYIVLFHNAALHTPEALPTILETLLQEGYTFVPISQLLLTGEYTIDHEGRQWAAE